MARLPPNGGPPSPAPWPPNPYAAPTTGVSDYCSSGASTPPLVASRFEDAAVADPPVEGAAPASTPASSPLPTTVAAADAQPVPQPRASSPPSLTDDGVRPAATAPPDGGGGRPAAPRSPPPQLDAATGDAADACVTHVSSPPATEASEESPPAAAELLAEGKPAEAAAGPSVPPCPSATAGFTDSVMALRGEVARLADGHARQTDLEDAVAALRAEVARLADRTARQAALEGTVTALRRDVARLATATARQADELATMAAAQRGLAARSTNTGRSRMVWNSYRRARAGCPPWYTFLKEREGNGPLLPGVPPLDVPEVPVGAPLPAPFPTTYEATTVLDDDDLAVICSWLHDTAGVTKGDPIGTRRAKVMARLCWWG